MYFTFNKNFFLRIIFFLSLHSHCKMLGPAVTNVSFPIERNSIMDLSVRLKWFIIDSLLVCLSFCLWLFLFSVCLLFLPFSLFYCLFLVYYFYLWSFYSSSCMSSFYLSVCLIGYFLTFLHHLFLFLLKYQYVSYLSDILLFRLFQ